MNLEDLTVDQLLAEARRLQSHSSTLSALTSSPETRETIQRAMKKLNPKLSIPEIDARDAVMKDVNELREDNEKLRREIQEQGIRDRLEKQRAALISKHGFTEADMAEVEKMMTRETDAIPTYEAAALVYKASKQSATPTPAAFVPPNFALSDGKDDPWAAGMTANAPGSAGNRSRLDRIGMDEAYKAMNELFGGKVPGLGSAKAN